MKAITRTLRKPARRIAASRVPAVHVTATDAQRDLAFVRRQLPLSFAPYRLQAADRWWHEEGAKRA